MMVKRVVDTKFWTSMDVIDNYSVEDKFFALYLMTNGRSTQSGIYSLPKKIISFETGFTIDVIQVLLDRFSKEYGRIAYSDETQELTLLNSLEYTILKGGAPVSELLERELRAIQDGKLILMTYERMKSFWENSRRKFDQIIQSIFEAELIQRKLFMKENEKDNEKENDNMNVIYNDNHNDNEESDSRNRLVNQKPNRKINQSTLINTDGLMPGEQVYLTKYIEFIKYKNPSFDRPVTTKEILCVFYEEIIGKVTSPVRERIKSWEKELAKSVILEAFIRSIDKKNPLAYANSIINYWIKEEVKNLRDVSHLDRKFKEKNELNNND